MPVGHWSNTQHGALITEKKSVEWYSQWLQRQEAEIPPSVLDSITSLPAISTKFSILIHNQKSLEAIATSFIDGGLIQASSQGRARDVARLMAFTLLGWQSMLYRPAFGTAPLQQLAITDDFDGFQGQAFMAFKQDQSRIKKSVPEFLLGFGVLLPQGNLCLSEDQTDIDAFEHTGIVSPETMNAALLCSIARIRIQWVDVMAPHLEFDKETNTLFLFRYPSFCLANLDLETDSDLPRILKCCAKQHQDPPQWAGQEEVGALLAEILLSYRLLFGQDKKSRALFKTMKPKGENTSHAGDDILGALCSQSNMDLPEACHQRTSYRLSRDFPILRCRLAILQQYMSSTKPRSWRQIWLDQRDSPQWYTFWAVIIFGLISILLTLVQTILQIVQVAEPN